MPTSVRTSGVTFAVHDVKPATGALPVAPALLALKQMLGRPVEACSEAGRNLATVKVHHGLISAAQRAFMDHRPLALSPDMIWLAIIQGIAQHVPLHRDELWHHFAGSDVDLELELIEQDFVPGSQENLWEEVIHGFAAQIHRHVAPAHDAIVAQFSTTGAIERLAFEVALMEVVGPYTVYRLFYVCGIPEITLEGTCEDWKQLRDRAKVLKKYGLEWWYNPLRKILDQFVRASRGDVNVGFWRRIVSSDAGCGGDLISGWIGHLVPYIREQMSAQFNKRNPLLTEKGEGLRIDAFPRGLSRVPFRWSSASGVLDMNMLAGFVGYASQRGAIRPHIGWAIQREGLDSSITKLLAALENKRPPLSPDRLMSAGKRLFSSFEEVPGGFQKLYTECNGGAVGTCTIRELGDCETRWFDIPRADVPGFGWANTLRTVTFADFGDGTVAALAVRLGYIHHGAILRLPNAAKPTSAPIMAHGLEDFAEKLLTGDSRRSLNLAERAALCQ